jgi:hypothetical protein
MTEYSEHIARTVKNRDQVVGVGNKEFMTDVLANL